MAFSLFRRRVEAQEAHQYGDGPFSVNGHEPLTREGRLTRSEEAKLYETAPSIIDHIPGEYLPEHQCILLDDGVSVGAVYEIIPVGTEGRPDSHLEKFATWSKTPCRTVFRSWIHISGWCSSTVRTSLT
jgi:hypothetical protein